MTRTDIINGLIAKNGYKSYLEIGVQVSACNFDIIKCKRKVGVDPTPIKFSLPVGDMEFHKCTSDAFFASSKETFDIIFIDGLHVDNQVFKDILNALAVLNPKGTIVCHDMNPKSEKAQKVPPVQAEWNGNCWRAYVKLRQYRKDLSMYVVDTDQGCGIIKKGKQDLIKIKGDLTYKEFAKNRQNWLNLISVEAFKKKVGI